MTQAKAKELFKTKVPVIYNGKKYRVVGLMAYIDDRERPSNSVCIRGLNGEGTYWVSSESIENEP